MNKQSVFKYFTNLFHTQQNVYLNNDTPKFNLMYLIKIFADQKSFDGKYNDVKILEIIDTNAKKDNRPVFVFPGFEGRMCYVESAIKHLKRPVYCFQYPYEKSTGNIAELAAKILPLVKQYSKLDQPVDILAHSFGGLVAFDITKLLESENIKVRLCLTDSSPYALKIMVSASFGCIYPLEEFENNIIFNLTHCLGVQDAERFKEEIKASNHWCEKLNIILPTVSEQVPYNEQILKLLFTATYNTIRSILLYNESSEKLNAEVTLIRSTTKNLPFPNDFRISKYFANPVKEMYTDGHHINMLKFEKTINMINDVFNA